MTIRRLGLRAGLGIGALAIAMSLILGQTCTVEPPTGSLAVNAGTDATIAPTESVILQGVATGGSGVYSYRWSPTTGLSDSSASAPVFTPSSTGQFLFTLIVTDSLGAVVTDSAIVTVTEDAQPPVGGELVADAGDSVIVSLGSPVTLQGSAAGGTGVFTYAWNPTTGLSDPNIATPTFTSAVGGATTFTLTVTDSAGATATASTTVTATVTTALSALTWGADFGEDGYRVIGTFETDMDAITAQNENNYRVNASGQPPTSAVLGGDGRTVSLTFNTPLAMTSALDFSVNNGLRDVAGAAIAQFTSTPAAHSGDTTGPLVETNGVKWEANFTGSYQINVTFTEALDRASAETSSAYRIASTSTTATDADLGDDGRTVAVVFDGIRLDESDLLDVSLANAVQDINGNPLAQQLGLGIQANPSDLRRPEVTTVTPIGQTSSGFEVSVEFDEAMSRTASQTASGYLAQGSVSEVPDTATLGINGRTVVLQFASALAPTDTLLIGVGGVVTDINGVAVLQVSETVGSVEGDVSAPNAPTLTWLANNATGGYQLEAVFNEDMNKAGVETVANWEINGTGTNPTTVVLDADLKTATLTFGVTMRRTEKLVVSVDDAIRDANGNPLSESVVEIDANAADLAAPSVSTSPLWAANYGTIPGQPDGYQLTLSFSEVMDLATTGNAANYRMVRVDTSTTPDTLQSTLVNPSNVLLDAAGRQVTLSFANSPAGFRSSATSVILDKLQITNSVRDINGRTTTDTLPLAISLNTSDTAAPTLASGTPIKWSILNDRQPYQVTVRYNEAMDATTSTNAAHYTLNAISPDASDVTGTAPVLSADGKTVTLTFSVDASATFQPSGTLTIAGPAVTDVNGNALAAVANHAVAQDATAAGDLTIPSLVSAVWSTGPFNDGVLPTYDLVATFTEALDKTFFDGNPPEAAFSLTPPGGTAGPITLNKGGNTVNITFTGAAYPTSTTLEVTGSVDMHGNGTAGTSSVVTTRNPLDIKVPEVATSQWGSEFAGPGYQILLVFSEVLDMTFPEPVNRYRITGTSTTATSAALGTDGKTVTLVFNGVAMNTGSQIDVSVGNSIADVNGNFLVETLGQAVAANGADVAGPAAPALSHTAAALQVTVLFDEAMDETSCETLANWGKAPTAATPTIAQLGTDGKTVTLTYAADPGDGGGGESLTIAAAVTDINGQGYAAGNVVIPN